MNNNQIFPPWPSFSEDEIQSTSNILRSGKINYWTGDEGKLFEKEFSEFHQQKYGIALANGTLALELALYAFDIGEGDEVIVPSRTFLATASSVVMRRATPIVADIDLNSQNMTAETIKPLISSKTKAIIVVHLAGWPCDIDPIISLAKQHNLIVIEDCAQAHGAKYKGRYVGSFGDAAAFSFCQDKIMTTAGEGGMLLMSNEKAWEKAWAYKDHGKDYHLVHKKDHPPGFRWLHTSFGTNWRLTELQSAIGRIQLRKLNDWVAIRRRNAEILTKSFCKIPAFRVTIPTQECYHSYYKYYVFVDNAKLNVGWSRDRIMNEINSHGIPCFTGSCSEIYLEKAFTDKHLQPQERLPNAKKLGEESLMFLVHPTCGEKDMYRICEVVEGVMRNITR